MIKREHHGLRNTKLYSTWKHMRQRCNDVNEPAYKNYGARGIKICKEWDRFSCFYKWAMNNGFDVSLFIDRIDNNNGYSPENCRFVTRKTNNNNTRQNVKVTAFGETKNMKEWAEDKRCNVKYVTLRYRILEMGLEPELAMTIKNCKKENIFRRTKELSEVAVLKRRRS